MRTVREKAIGRLRALADNKCNWHPATMDAKHRPLERVYERAELSFLRAIEAFFLLLPCPHYLPDTREALATCDSNRRQVLEFIEANSNVAAPAKLEVRA